MSQQVIFLTKQAIDEARSVGDNKRALVAMAMGGQMIGVDAGTRVVIVDYEGSGIYRIRVLEGQMIGRTGYVPKGFLGP